MAAVSFGLASRQLVVVTVLLGTLTVSLNNTALNPAVPQFMSAFGIGAATASWIITGFMLGMGMTMPATGFLGDRFGKKAVYLFGLVLFIGGSCVGALATAMSWVIAARCIQGIAGGLMIPLSLALIFEVYPKAQRGRITGWWGTAVMLAPAVGPAIGGLVVQFFDWHALFLINVPVGVLAAVVACYCLPQSAPERLPSVAPKFDWRGFALVTVGIGALLITLSGPFNLTVLAAALACLVWFVRAELTAPEPLLNVRIFGVRSYSVSVVLVVAQSIGMFGSLVLVPLFMQNVLGHGAALTGLALFATAVCSAAFTNVGGTLLDSKGPRGVVTVGLIVSALATLAFAFLDGHTSLLWIFGLMMARGVGIGLSYIPVTTAGLNAIPERLVTQGAAMNNILRRVAASVAVVLVSSYYELRAPGATAIQEIFLAIGVLMLLAAPLAWTLPNGMK
jgi:EmrB/QacA subfamily drug resistance transporter